MARRLTYVGGLTSTDGVQDPEARRAIEELRAEVARLSQRQGSSSVTFQALSRVGSDGRTLTFYGRTITISSDGISSSGESVVAQVAIGG